MTRTARRRIRRLSRRIRWPLAYALVLLASLGLFIAGLHSCSTPPDTAELSSGVSVETTAR